MEVIVEQAINTYIGPYASLGPIVTAVAGTGLLVSGVAARIVELGQAVSNLLTDRAAGDLRP